MTQADRLLRWIRANPGTSSLEITVALGIVNTTGRISDLRAAGHVIDAKRDRDGVFRYSIVTEGQLALAL